MNNKRQVGAFTLIEMLVVIGIIAILAGLVVHMAGVAKEKRIRSRVTVQMQQISTAIADFQSYNHFLPPDNPNSSSLSAADPQRGVKNQLFYELTGVMIIAGTQNPMVYTNLNGTTIIATNFGVGGFVNSVKAEPVHNYFSSAKINYDSANINVAPSQTNNPIYVLTTGVDWPDEGSNLAVPNSRIIPWHYVTSNPEHNRDSYDLWADVKIGKNIVSFNNWSSK